MSFARALLLSVFLHVPIPSLAAAQPPPPPEAPEEAEPAMEPEPAEEVEPAEEAVPDAQPALQVSAAPGRGFTVAFGDAFAMNVRARIQLRSTTAWTTDDGDGRNPTHEIQPRTLRLSFGGNVLSPNVRYAIQLALGKNDFESGNPSPIFDAFVDFTHLRDLNVRVGQYFVPFSRARTIREFALQTVDRATVVRELTLDRDVGVMFHSQDLFGLGGRLTYQLGVFGGEGRNRFGGSTPGFLYAARIGVRPFGPFVDDQEGDVEHLPTPRLLIGISAAYDQNAVRERGTTGDTYAELVTDYLNLGADVLFKWRGLFFLGEVIYRDASRDEVTFPDPDDPMATITDHARSGYGYLLQASYGPIPELDVWARWNALYARGGTDPDLEALAENAGREIAGGVNYYASGHLFKAQLDYGYTFVAGDFDDGAHAVRLQLDASF